MSAAGLRRIVLINSAGFGKADLTMDGSVHIAGDNGFGKTSIINAFQFLYVDDWKRMRFPPNTTEDTKRFYFGTHSYILIEVDTPSGIKVVGFRGLGGQGDYECERFVYDGPYADDDYYPEGDRQETREWEDIAQNRLAPKVRPKTKFLLTRAELRCAMMGSGESGGVRLCLAPATDNGAFVKQFLHNLSLVQITEGDLKDMILDALGGQIACRTLNLAKDCEAMYQNLDADERALRLLAGAEREASLLASDHAKLQAAEHGLPGEWAFLDQTLRLTAAALKTQAADQESSLEASREAVTVRKTRLADVRGRTRAAEARITKAETLLEGFDREAARFAGNNRDLLEGAAEAMGKTLGTLYAQLQILSTPGSRQQIADQLKRLAAKRAEKQAALDHPTATVAARILGECEDREREAVLRFLHPDVMGLPEGPEGVTVKDGDKLFRLIGALGAQVTKGVFENAAVRINLNGVAVPSHGVFDPLDLQREIEALEAEEGKLRALLKEASSKEAIETEIRDKETQQRGFLAEVADYDRWRQHEERERPDLEASLAAAHTETEALRAQDRDLAQELVDLDEAIREAAKAIRGLQAAAADLEARLRLFATRTNPQWDLPEPSPTCVPMATPDLTARLAAYETRFADAGRLDQNVRRSVLSLQDRLGSLLPGADPDAIVATLADLMGSIPGRRALVENEKRGMIAQAKRRFKDFHDGYECVRSWVERLNREFAGIQISDLRSVKVQLATAPQAKLIEGFVNAQTSPLFADDNVDEAIDKVVAHLNEKRSLNLEDMFELHIRVESAGGEVKVYDRVNIGSKGTGITFKVVFLAMLLKEGARSRNNDIRFPLFVDEVDILDDPNRATVLSVADTLGFQVLMASPNSVPARRMYFLYRSADGKTWVTFPDERLLIRAEEDAGTDGNGGTGHGPASPA